MHKLFIENYIKQINKSDILVFANKNNIQLSEKDVDILYHYLKNKWQDLLYGNSTKIFNELEKQFDSEKFLAIKNLYYFYFDKYQDFL